MNKFAEQFITHQDELRTNEENARLQAEANAAREFAEKIETEKKKKELQLVIANQMREDAKSIVSVIPDSLQPTTLVLTKVARKPKDVSGMNRKNRKYYADKTEIFTKDVGTIKAWLAEERFQRSWDYDEGDPRTLVFKPIFVGETGELWVVPDVRRTDHDWRDHTSVEQVRAGYREELRGTKLRGYPIEGYKPENDISNSPRLATDDDLLPLDKLSLSQLEGDLPTALADFRNGLLKIVE